MSRNSVRRPSRFVLSTGAFVGAIARSWAAGAPVPTRSSTRPDLAIATAVRALLQKARDVNQPSPDGSTALHWAAENDDRELVDDAAAGPAPTPRRSNRYGVQPISLAAVNGNAAIIEPLAQSRSGRPTARCRKAKRC